MNVQEIFRSGLVQRYSTNPDMAWAGQTNGHHAWGVSILLLGLFGARVDIETLREALHHDCGEMGTCDMSRPNKRRHVALADLLADAEAEERLCMGIPEAYLPAEQADMLVLCDGLESWMFARIRTPWVLDRDGWPEMRTHLLKSADRLGVGEKVREMLEADT